MTSPPLATTLTCGYPNVKPFSYLEAKTIGLNFPFDLFLSPRSWYSLGDTCSSHEFLLAHGTCIFYPLMEKAAYLVSRQFLPPSSFNTSSSTLFHVLISLFYSREQEEKQRKTSFGAGSRLLGFALGAVRSNWKHFFSRFRAKICKIFDINTHFYRLYISLVEWKSLNSMGLTFEQT